ncbi:MAG: DUF1127 domain-containing protein [Alphaproteobacteria bacterium]
MTTRIATFDAPTFGLPSPRPIAPARRLAALAAAMIGAWQARDQHRRCMAQLDSHLLQDIGLTTRDQLREVEKPLWRA